MAVRIASFNAENLMARFDFSKQLSKLVSAKKKHKEQPYPPVSHEDDARQMTALALADCCADIVCLQEVEDLRTLERFEKTYLQRMMGIEYPQKILIEGNDGRGIDVALMARHHTSDGEPIEILHTQSHRHKTFGQLGLLTKELAKRGVEKNDRIFRRDCLEVDLKIGKNRLTLFVCHFKSMGAKSFEEGKQAVSGRDYTMAIRQAEAKAVRHIIEEKFGSSRSDKMRWMICGDLNDYTEKLEVSGHRNQGYEFHFSQESDSGVAPLLKDGFCVDLMQRRPQTERWTLYHASGPVADIREPHTRAVRQLVQLDYLLASPALADSNKQAVPDIMRQGQPIRAIFPTGQEVARYPRTGWDRPKASDHCPVAVTLAML